MKVPSARLTTVRAGVATSRGRIDQPAPQRAERHDGAGAQRDDLPAAAGGAAAGGKAAAPGGGQHGGKAFVVLGYWGGWPSTLTEDTGKVGSVGSVGLSGLGGAASGWVLLLWWVWPMPRADCYLLCVDRAELAGSNSGQGHGFDRSPQCTDGLTANGHQFFWYRK